MSNVIDMASFEHLRRSNANERYTCPKTEITFPIIYKVVTPDADFVDEVVAFTGTFTTSYKLKAPSDQEQPIFPGFPLTTATQISTLDSEDEIFLDLIHFENKERAKGFRDACGHLGIEPEHVSGFKDSQGYFLLLTRRGNQKKQGHIIYRSSKNQFFEALRCEIECEYVAAFNQEGEIITLQELECIPD